MAIGAPLNIHEALLGFDDRSRLPRPETLFDRLILKELIAVMGRHLGYRASMRLSKTEVFEDYVRLVVLPAYPDAPPLVGAYLGQARCTRPEIMSNLAVPVALLHPVDDPIVPVAHCREALAAADGNPFVWGREFAHGGHVCMGPVDPLATLSLIGTFFGRLRD